MINVSETPIGNIFEQKGVGNRINDSVSSEDRKLVSV